VHRCCDLSGRRMRNACRARRGSADRPGARGVGGWAVSFRNYVDGVRLSQQPGEGEETAESKGRRRRRSPHPARSENGSWTTTMVATFVASNRKNAVERARGALHQCEHLASAQRILHARRCSSAERRSNSSVLWADGQRAAVRIDDLADVLSSVPSTSGGRVLWSLWVGSWSSHSCARVRCAPEERPLLDGTEASAVPRSGAVGLSERASGLPRDEESRPRARERAGWYTASSSSRRPGRS
jgi:hypothetical protein